MVSGINIPKKFDAVEISRVFWYDNDNSLVECGPPNINADGSLFWPGTTPPTGKTYSITGRRHAQFYAYAQLPLDRAHHQGLDLPRRVVLRNFSLYEL